MYAYERNIFNNIIIYIMTSNYKYSQTWFFGSEIKHNLAHFLDKTKENKILEIGCFEGLSSVFFADNFLDNINSRLTCVDPFLTVDNNDHIQFLQNNEEMNFDYNISVCKNSDKITVHKTTSDVFLEIITKNIILYILMDAINQILLKETWKILSTF